MNILEVALKNILHKSSHPLLSVIDDQPGREINYKAGVRVRPIVLSHTK